MSSQKKMKAVAETVTPAVQAVPKPRVKTLKVAAAAPVVAFEVAPKVAPKGAGRRKAAPVEPVAAPVVTVAPAKAAPKAKARQVKPVETAAPAPKPGKRAKASVAAEPETLLSALTGSAEVLRRSGNKRSEQTIERIFDATEQAILESGTDRIAILDVCKSINISRGTFYRYFASQDELLDAYSRHKRESFHKNLSAILLAHDDPDRRFDAFIEYVDAYMTSGRPRRLLLKAPEFALGFFKRVFHDAVVRFQDLLGPVFDAWDERLATKLDRELVCELIFRFILSESLIGDSAGSQSMPRRIGRLVDLLRFGGATRARR